MRRWRLFGMAICAAWLVACGAAATPSVRPTAPAAAGATAVAGTPAPPPSPASPTIGATPPARPGSPTARATPVASPVAPWPGNAFLQLFYQGRAYRSFWARPVSGSPTIPAGIGTPELGPPVGRTFARWQTANLAPAGIPIRSIVG